jgi:hypothetical protein
LGEPFNISVPPDKDSINLGKSESEIPTFRQMLGVNVKVFDLQASDYVTSNLNQLNGTSITGRPQKVLDIFSHFRVFYPCNRDYWRNGEALPPFSKSGQIPKNNMSNLKLLVDENGIPVRQGTTSMGSKFIYPKKNILTGRIDLEEEVIPIDPVTNIQIYLNPYINYMNNNWINIKYGSDYISQGTQAGLNKKLTVTLEVIARNIIPEPNTPNYDFPRRWFLKDDWGADPDEIKWNAKAYATMFARAYSPKGFPERQLVDILEIGNEPWGYADATTYQAIMEGFIEGINQYYDGNEPNKIKVLSAAFQANHAENSADAVNNKVLSWKDYMGSKISPVSKTAIVGVNVHIYSNTIIGDGDELTKNVCNPEKVNVSATNQQTAASRFYYIRNAWKWAQDNLQASQRNIYMSEFGWDSDRCEAEKSVGSKTQAIYTIRNLFMMGRYGVKRATL